MAAGMRLFDMTFSCRRAGFAADTAEAPPAWITRSENERSK